MRWLVAGSSALLVAWGGYVASPYWALWDLADALNRRDVARLVERVNVTAVRFSLAKQVAAEGLTWSGQSISLNASERDAAAGTIAATADPLAATLVTGDSIARLLTRPIQAVGPEESRSVSSAAGRALRIVASSRWRGFRNMYVEIPPEAPTGSRIRLQFRLARLTWRLVSVDLPKAERRTMLQDFVRARR